MAEKRKKGRWGKLGIDSKSRNWLRDEFPIKELISELVAEGQINYKQLIKRFKDNKYPVLSVHKNLGRIARLGRDIRRRKEMMKTTDDPTHYKYSKDLIRTWKNEADQRKWLVKIVSKKINLDGKGQIRRQNKKGKKMPYLYIRIYWWGKKRDEYLGEESQFKSAFKRQSTFKDYNEFLLDKGRKKFKEKLGTSAYKSEASVLQKKLYQERLLD